MALIACKECGKQVSTEAASCPNCGAQVDKKKPSTSEQISGFIGLALMGWLAYVFLWPSEKPAQPPKPEPIRLKAEQVIKFPEPKVACNTIDEYKEEALHAVRKEETKFKAMFADLKCIPIPSNVDFKILSVTYGSEDFDIIEITSADNTHGADGLFTEWDYKK